MDIPIWIKFLDEIAMKFQSVDLHNAPLEHDRPHRNHGRLSRQSSVLGVNTSTNYIPEEWNIWRMNDALEIYIDHN